ncbi:MAG: phosphoglycerate mutase, partial [bacterium]|nr:phosphoglycerate mutase [bacterium]
MKYIVCLGDGMSDWPIEALGNQTPLAYAKTPHMDALAAQGRVGLVDTVEEPFY